MNVTVLLKIDGEVKNPMELTFDDLAAIQQQHQIANVSRIDPKHKGDAVTLCGLLDRVGVKPTATYLGLHASADDFHASVPLEAVRELGLLIYRLDGQPLSFSAGGPLRFYIRDFAVCHTEEVDECANVKFVDHIELTDGKGYDNRPEDEQAHQRLHNQQDKQA